MKGNGFYIFFNGICNNYLSHKQTDMKYLLSILLIFYSSISFGQNNRIDSTYSQLIDSLNAESWSSSEKICKNLLDYTETIDSLAGETMVLRYIYIYTNAGLLNEKKITQTEALNKVKYLKGKEMIMPSHPFNSNCYVNCTQLSSEDKNTFFTAVNNDAGTQIFAFEYVTIKDGIQETKEALEGNFITLKGVLNEVTVEGNMFPRFKLKFKDGEYRIVEKE